jgi:fucose 4-O-acetylase-like acetyltransferase
VLNIKEEIVVLVSYIIIFAIIEKLGLTCFGIDMISSFWLYFALGFYLRKYDVVSVLSKTAVCIPLLILSIPISLFYQRNGEPVFGFIPYFLYIRIVAIICSLAFIGLAAKVGNDNNHIINKVGRCTLGIYAIHLQFFIKPEWYQIMAQNTLVYYLLVVALAILMTFVSYVIMTLIKKNKYTSFMFLGQ